MKVKVQLFGKFTLTNGNRILNEETLHSKKLMRLLAYFIVNRDTILSHQKLIEVFWEDETRHPEGALKNLMYRLRTVMRELGDETYICTLPGAYRWNPEIDVETDYERFEELAARLRTVQTYGEETGRICEEALACYRGNFSARIAEEPWLLSRTIWYQSLYMDITKTLCAVYQKAKKWDLLERLCNQALAVDAYDEEVHCWLLESLRGQKKYKLAAKHYERTAKLYYNNMGIRLTGRIQEIYQSLMRESGGATSSIAGVIRETRENGRPEGAYLCEYPVFRQVYRVEARRITRLGIAEYILMLTVRASGPEFPDESADLRLGKAMDALERVICKYLRAGDVVSRYSPTQFIVMLPTCSYESGTGVAERIRRNFKRYAEKYRCEVAYELAELSAVI